MVNGVPLRLNPQGRFSSDRANFMKRRDWLKTLLAAPLAAVGIAKPTELLDVRSIQLAHAAAKLTGGLSIGEAIANSRRSVGLTEKMSVAVQTGPGINLEPGKYRIRDLHIIGGVVTGFTAV